jgi:hypothetical protein
MIKPRKLPAGSLLRFAVRIAFWGGVATGLSACGLMSHLGDPQIVSYEYRPLYGYVRIERIEAGAPDNAHPFGISVDALSQALASLKVEGGASMSVAPMFSEGELKEIVPHLVAALAKAGPRQDLTFAVTGKHGSFGWLSSKSVTTGRLFVRDRELNVIFRLVHELYEDGELGYGVPPVFLPGTRVHRSDTGWRLVPANGRLANGRADWVMLDTTILPKPKETTGGTSTAPAAPAADSRHQEIESRLRALDRLKADRLITEEEYAERRRAILQGL